MKKCIKIAAIAAAALTLFTAYAAPKKDKAAKEKPAKEKSAKEKPAKGKKAKFDQEAYDAAFVAGDYDTCVAMLREKNDKHNLVKDSLDADMLLLLSGNYLGSGKSFLETYGLMQQSTSEMDAGKSFSAAIAGENVLKYTGAEYERYLAWSMRLADALALKQTDVASGIMKDYVGTFMDEIQAIRAKNEEMAKKSEEALTDDKFKNAQKVLDGVVDFGIAGMIAKMPPKSKAKYETSPFFNYLGTLAFATAGDFEHAADFAGLYKVPGAKGITSVPAGKGRLEVVALSGTIGQREEASVRDSYTITKFTGAVTLGTKLAYPVFQPQPHEIDSVKVTLSDGSSAVATVIEDFDKAVAIDVAQRARAAYSRSIFRNIMKNSIIIASLIAADEIVKQSLGDPFTAKAAELGYAKAMKEAEKGFQAFLDNERADVRQGIYFPHKANAAGFSVAPGTYTVTVEYLNGSNVVETKTIENVVVEDGKVCVAVSSCEK